MGRVILVDEQDEEVGCKSYKDMQYEDIYRVTGLWLTDISGEYCLITQRKWTKNNDPGKWSVAVSGTVEEGETYDENIAIEIEEEIGLKNVEFKKATKSFVDDGKHKFFKQLYTASIDKDKAKIVIQEEEVEDYEWIKVAELVKDLKSSPNKYTPSMAQGLKLLGVIDNE